MKEEGLMTLWRGSGPTIGRAMAINFGMLTSYDEIKERLNKYKGTQDDLQTRLTASAMAGVISSFLCLPFDNLKVSLNLYIIHIFLIQNKDSKNQI